MPIMERHFIHILEDCLSRLDRGELLLEVLGSYPTLEGKLRPLLLIAMLSRALPQPAPRSTAIRKGKNRMLAEMNRMGAEKASQIPKSRQPAGEVVEGWLERIPNPFQPGQVGNLNLGYRLAIATVVLLMGGGLLTLNASASGLPGGVFEYLNKGYVRAREVLLFNSSVVESPSADEEVAEVADSLAGNPEDLSTTPGFDPSVITEKSIPGLEDFNSSTKSPKDKKDQSAAESSDQDLEETTVEDQVAVEEEEKDEKPKEVKEEKTKEVKEEKTKEVKEEKVKEEKDKKVKEQKAKRVKKNTDTVKKDKGKDKDK